MQIEAKDEYGDEQLHYACENGSLPIIDYLISKGGIIKAKENIILLKLFQLQNKAFYPLNIKELIKFLNL